MKPCNRRIRTRTFALVGASVALGTFAATASAFDWVSYREESTVEILTVDENGSPRETKIWIVVLEEVGFIRTNDSRWLANILRGSTVQLRARGVETDVTAESTDDPAEYDRVEAAFKEKYGLMQKTMSLFRTSRPTVLRVMPRLE